VGFIDLDQPIVCDPAEDLLGRRSITASKQRLNPVELLEADSQAEAVVEHLLQVLETDPVDDVLVHCPTLQAVEMNVEPFVLFGQKRSLACLTPVTRSVATDHLAADTARCEFEVIRHLCVSAVGEPFDLSAFTEGAPSTLDLNLLVYR